MKKDTLSQLDKLIAEIPDNGPPQPNEFTIEDWMERRKLPNNHNGKQQAYRELKAYLASGHLTVRKGLVKKKQANIYAIANK